MSMNHIYLGQHSNQRGSQLQAWIMANGIDPALVPHESVAEIHGSWITYVIFKIDYRTKLRVIGDERYEKEFLSVPLVARPEEFGL
ncbi:hypothetical protein ACIOTN_17085 [Glutamicibacter sp. NPDC087661]|uniref:hypothetical protein n=1 Tax=Glutamicibacter sp. NPDC087661 TaxID=3363996 RepID=UPI00382673C0